MCNFYSRKKEKFISFAFAELWCTEMFDNRWKTKKYSKNSTKSAYYLHAIKFLFSDTHFLSCTMMQRLIAILEREEDDVLFFNLFHSLILKLSAMHQPNNSRSFRRCDRIHFFLFLHRQSYCRQFGELPFFFLIPATLVPVRECLGTEDRRNIQVFPINSGSFPYYDADKQKNKTCLPLVFSFRKTETDTFSPAGNLLVKRRTVRWEVSRWFLSENSKYAWISLLSNSDVKIYR